MTRYTVHALILAVFLGYADRSHVQAAMFTVTNGTFDIPDLAENTNNLSNGSPGTAITSWTISGAANGAGQTAKGGISDLGGEQTARIFIPQTQAGTVSLTSLPITTVVDNTDYLLSVDVMHTGGTFITTGNLTSQIQILANGLVVAGTNIPSLAVDSSQTLIVTWNSAFSNTGETITARIIESKTAANLGGPLRVDFDNVTFESIEAVPEPGTLALCLASIAVFSLVVWKRRRRSLV